MKTFKEIMEIASVYVSGDEPAMYSKAWHHNEAKRYRADAEKYRGIGFHVLAKHKDEEADKHEKHASEAE